MPKNIESVRRMVPEEWPWGQEHFILPPTLSLGGHQHYVELSWSVCPTQIFAITAVVVVVFFLNQPIKKESRYTACTADCINYT